MKQDMAVLQRMLEQKERKMQELMRNSGQVPALKQHYDRVLQVRGGSGGGGRDRVKGLGLGGRALQAPVYLQGRQM